MKRSGFLGLLAALPFTGLVAHVPWEFKRDHITASYTHINSAYDELSKVLLSAFQEYVDDNVFATNMVFARGWETAMPVDPDRFVPENIKSKRGNAWY